MSGLVITTHDGAIATVTLDNPGKRNALTKAAWVHLGETMQDLSADDAVRCVVIRGAGNEAFAAGADISEFPTARANAAQARAYGEVVSDAIGAILDCRHPTLAMIRGACTGGGLEVACACDIRISGASGRFGIPIGRLGHALGHAEMKVVRDLVGHAMLMELLLECRIVDAAEAERRGLVNRVVDDQAVEAETYAAARRIAAAAPLSARANKKFSRRLMDPAPLSDAERAEADTICDTDDYQEGFRAFLEKRKPVFKGR